MEGAVSTQIVFAVYRPNDGQDVEFRALIARHVPALKKAGLVTKRDPLLLKSSDGSYIEIFEWASVEAARKAHDYPEVAEIWDRMGAIGSFGKLADLPEAGRQFPHFESV
jgi:hypothetical protein